MKTSLGSFFYGHAVYALTLTGIPRGVRMPFFTRNPFRPTYFLPTAAKSKQKMPLEGNSLNPLIYSFCWSFALAPGNDKLNRLPWRLPCKIHLIIGEL
jgi:hypothetical protein